MPVAFEVASGPAPNWEKFGPDGLGTFTKFDF